MPLAVSLGFGQVCLCYHSYFLSPTNKCPAFISLGQTANRAETGRSDQRPARTCTTQSVCVARSRAREGTNSSCPLAPRKPTLIAIVSVVATPPENQRYGKMSWRVRLVGDASKSCVQETKPSSLSSQSPCLHLVFPSLSPLLSFSFRSPHQSISNSL